MYFVLLYTFKYYFRSLTTLLKNSKLFQYAVFSPDKKKQIFLETVKKTYTFNSVTSLPNVNLGQCNDIWVSEFVRWQTVVILFMLYILINPFGAQDLVKHLVAINNLYLKYRYVFCESFTRVLNWSQFHLNIYFTVIFPPQTSSGLYLCNDILIH